MSFFSDFKESLTYPFEDKNWPAKLWPLPVIAFIPIIGLLSPILLKGWRFETVKNISTGEKDLPPFDPIMMFKHGLILWVAMTAHIFVPSILCSILGIGGPIGFIEDVYQILVNGFSAWAQSEPKDWALTVTIYLVWGVISFPVFQAGMVRYANSGNWKALYNTPLNFIIFIRHLHFFIKFYLSWLLLIILIAILDSMLAITGVGIFIIPMVSIVGYYVSSAHELGDLAQKVKYKEQATPPPTQHEV